MYSEASWVLWGELGVYSGWRKEGIHLDNRFNGTSDLWDEHSSFEHSSARQWVELWLGWLTRRCHLYQNLADQAVITTWSEIPVPHLIRQASLTQMHSQQPSLPRRKPAGMWPHVARKRPPLSCPSWCMHDLLEKKHGNVCHVWSLTDHMWSARAEPHGISSSIEHKEKGRVNEDHVATSRGCRSKIDSELSPIYDGTFHLQNSWFIPLATSGDSKVLYLKTTGRECLSTNPCMASFEPSASSRREGFQVEQTPQVKLPASASHLWDNLSWF